MSKNGSEDTSKTRNWNRISPNFSRKFCQALKENLHADRQLWKIDPIAICKPVTQEPATCPSRIAICRDRRGKTGRKSGIASKWLFDINKSFLDSRDPWRTVYLQRNVESDGMNERRINGQLCTYVRETWILDRGSIANPYHESTRVSALSDSQKSSDTFDSNEQEKNKKKIQETINRRSGSLRYTSSDISLRPRVRYSLLSSV